MDYFLELVNFKTRVKNLFIFLIFYVTFFIYFRTVYFSNDFLLIFTCSLIIIIFLFSAFNSKIGLFIFIFLIPLLNTLTTILGVKPIPILLLLLFSFFMGFLLYSFANKQISLFKPFKYNFLFETEIGIAALVAFVIFLISAVISILRYSNFYPFFINIYHNLTVNINGQFDSTGAFFWVINDFFNYSVGFLILFSVFNVIKDLKDIMTAFYILILSTVLSSFMAIYQYFINPYVGSFKYWVDSGRLNATFTDPNSLGAFIVLIFPVFVLMIIIAKRMYLKIILGMLLIPFMLMVAFSGSRNAILGIFIESLIFILFGLIIRFSRLKSISRKGKKILLLVLILFIVFVLMLLAIFLTDNVVKNKTMEISLVKRTADTVKAFIIYYKQAGFIEAIKSISNYRYIYWNQAVNMTKDYPITGVGIGSYIIELPDYLYNFERDFTQVDFAGNYYLQVLSELGIPGLFLILFLFSLFIKKVSLYIKHSISYRNYSLYDWIPIGLFTSFIAMIIVLIFGPHTNFIEIQMIFWLIIGLMLAYLKVNKFYKKEIELISNKNYKIIDFLKLDKKLKLSFSKSFCFIIVVLIISVLFLNSSLTTLSIFSKQNRNNWKNEYGFYRIEKIGKIDFRWISIDASTVLEKKGNVMVIPVQDVYPEEYKETSYEPVEVKFFINYSLIEKVNLTDNEWYNVILNVPESTDNRITLTIVCSRSWIPKEIGLSNDTRELGIRVGDIKFR